MAFVLWLIVIVEFIILVRVLISGFNLEDKNEFTRKFVALVEPVLKPVRAVLPPLGNGMDISPIVIFLVLVIIRSLLS